MTRSAALAVAAMGFLTLPLLTTSPALAAPSVPPPGVYVEQSSHLRCVPGRFCITGTSPTGKDVRILAGAGIPDTSKVVMDEEGGKTLATEGGSTLFNVTYMDYCLYSQTRYRGSLKRVKAHTHEDDQTFKFASVRPCPA
ncbi:hypothetical protein GCM10010329_86190 [Streptomyces spiroverticillatus]|uniref:Uncharacterized protein n=1 Tax=Streptomyces finlayi TaxID=67296 RepID=A0A919CG94_9ACTN|nr:hypothetical protein [Streptomyces finlayi]GHA50985.1 hypothetical protein GCM10010329_86190 [Streptomyces spiroverticillatus]GHD20058.1 hypothetical protein GCM10010334_84250 [Streptomyces finlayi]